MPEERGFVPADFEPPTRLAVGDLQLEPLRPEHNERDYAAWTSSIDQIRRSPGFDEAASWPREMSLAENRADLERHARDFRDRAGFTYTVLGPGDDVVGCGDVYPTEDRCHDAKILPRGHESQVEW